MRLFVPVISSLLLSVSSAFASTLIVSDSGTFSNATPVSAISTPGGTFSLSFNVSSTPTVANIVSGAEFDVTYSNFSYLLNGIATSAAVGGITFFNASQLGLFNVCFVSICSVSTEVLSLHGGQVYSGSEASPTLLTGSDPSSSSSLFVAGVNSPLATDAPVVIAQAATAVTPEPSSFILLGTGLTGLCSLARRRFI